jgi:serine/threonine protein kinase
VGGASGGVAGASDRRNTQTQAAEATRLERGQFDRTQASCQGQMQPAYQGEARGEAVVQWLLFLGGVETLDDIKQSLKPGDLFAGKYRIERVLGEGGMGLVLSATHALTNDRVALKFLLSHAAESPDLRQRFYNEARAAVQIKSEHVARITDVDTMPSGLPYMVMEFLEGRDLGALIDQRGGLPLATAVDYVLQACEALAEAHALGIVHRDLKPANLFFTHAGTALR